MLSTLLAIVVLIVIMTCSYKKLFLWRQQPDVCENEFHHSLEIDTNRLADMTAVEQIAYFEDLGRKREAAHETDLWWRPMPEEDRKARRESIEKDSSVYEVDYLDK